MADGNFFHPIRIHPDVHAGKPGIPAGEDWRSLVDATATPWQVADSAVDHIVAARGRFLH